MTSFLKQLATNAINGDIGRHSPLGTKEPQGQVPHLPSRFKKIEAGPFQPALLSQTAIMELEPRVQLYAAGKSKNFLVDTGATSTILTSYSRAFFQTCNILDVTETMITERFTQALCFWDGQIFSHQFLVVPECLLMEEIFSAFEILLLLQS